MILAICRFLCDEGVQEQVKMISRRLFKGDASELLDLSRPRRMEYYTQFQEKFQWSSADEREITMQIGISFCREYRNMMNNVRWKAIEKVPDFFPGEDYTRLIPHRPTEILPADWERLCSLWNTPEWKHKAAIQGRKNKRRRDTKEGDEGPKHSIGPAPEGLHFDYWLQTGTTFSTTWQEDYAAAVTQGYGPDPGQLPMYHGNVWYQLIGGPRNGEWVTVPAFLVEPTIRLIG